MSNYIYTLIDKNNKDELERACKNFEDYLRRSSQVSETVREELKRFLEAVNLLRVSVARGTNDGKVDQYLRDHNRIANRSWLEAMIRRRKQN